MDDTTTVQPTPAATMVVNATSPTTESDSTSGLSTGAVVGIAVGSVVGVAALGGVGTLVTVAIV